MFFMQVTLVSWELSGTKPIPLEVMMISYVQRIVGMAILFPIPFVVAGVQGPPASPRSSTIESSYAAGRSTPLRRVQTRTDSNGTEVVSETTEVPDIDGK